jgi:hypothetical protein
MGTALHSLLAYNFLYKIITHDVREPFKCIRFCRSSRGRILRSPVLQLVKSCVRFEVFTTGTMKNGVFWDVTSWRNIQEDAILWKGCLLYGEFSLPYSQNLAVVSCCEHSVTDYTITSSLLYISIFSSRSIVQYLKKSPNLRFAKKKKQASYSSHAS